jgi:integrase
MAGVRKLPSGTWQGWYQHYEDRRVFFTLTRTATKREVLTAAQDLDVQHAKIRQGILPRPDQQHTALARPIDEVMGEYQAWGALQGGRGKRPWTPHHQVNLARQLAWWCRQLQLHSLGDTLGILPAVERGLQHLAAQGRSPNTLNQYLAALHGFVAWCRERDYLREDPLQHLTWLPTTPRVRRRAMTIEEIQRLLEACRPERYLIYQTALMTGLRANELRQLSLEHLDVERCALRLEADWTKNRQPEFQPLPRALVGALYASARSGDPQRCYARSYARPAGRLRVSYPAVPLLFVPLHTETMLYDDLRRAGIPQRTPAGKLDFHALRVAYINLVLDHGATPPEAQQLARHRTVALTISPEHGYARTREPRLQALVEGIAQLILGTP